jgi:DNA-binding LacI/PurR family transcriptional regulator
VVNIADVARHAGVAPSTVSYVLSGKRAISAGTRSRVLESVRVLNYHPHAGARALASNRANAIAVVVPLHTDSHVPVLMQFVVSVVTAAREYDHDVLLLTREEGEAGLQRVSGSALVDAIIVMDVELHDPRVPALRALERPSVLIGFPADTEGLTCIDLDFVAVGAVCVEHLAGLGHRRVALIGSPPAVYERETGFAERTASGFMEAATTYGVAATVHPCEPTPAAAGSIADKLLRDQPDLTAVVVHNESIVEPLVAAFQELGRTVPDDLSIVAICPDELAERVVPRLTSVKIPAYDVGRMAVELVMSKLDGRDVPSSTLLPPQLTARSSTRSPTATIAKSDRE